MKISINDKLPDCTDFIWVRRASTDAPELAYFHHQCEFPDWQFESPYTVGDREGLSTDYISDVTHWAELEPPQS